LRARADHRLRTCIGKRIAELLHLVSHGPQGSLGRRTHVIAGRLQLPGWILRPILKLPAEFLACVARGV
jgi:hypothetical protein